MGYGWKNSLGQSRWEASLFTEDELNKMEKDYVRKKKALDHRWREYEVDLEQEIELNFMDEE